jgi:hypothetical protein
MKTERASLSLRMPPAAIDKLRTAAAAEGITLSEFVARELEKKAIAAERGIPIAPLAPMVRTIRIDHEETCRMLAIEAAGLCLDAAALIPELVRIGLETLRDQGLRWRQDGEPVAGISPFRR